MDLINRRKTRPCVAVPYPTSDGTDSTEHEHNKPPCNLVQDPPLQAVRPDNDHSFTEILMDKLIDLKRRLVLPFSTFDIIEEHVLIVVALFIYTLTLCGSNPNQCEQTPIWKMHLLDSCSWRARAFALAWHYICVYYLNEALTYGIPWTFTNTSRIARASMQPGASVWRKNWIYTSNFLDLGLFYVVQPLLILYVSREFGRLCWLGTSGFESSFYAVCILAMLNTVFEVFEEMAYVKTNMDIRLRVCFLITTTVAILNQKGYIDSARLIHSWADAKKYYFLGRSVEVYQ